MQKTFRHHDPNSSPNPSQSGAPKRLSRRRFVAGLGAGSLGLSAAALLAGQAQASVAQNPALSALTTASLGDNPLLSRVAPSVTLGPPGGDSAIASSVLVPAVLDAQSGTLNPLFRARMMAPGQAGGALPDAALVRAVNVSPPPAAGSMVVAEFMTDGSQFELVEKGQGGKYRVTVDSKPVTLSAVDAAPANGAIYNRLVDFGGVRAQRLVRVEYVKNYFGGVRIDARDTLYPPHPPLGPRAVVLGDEWTAGAGADARFTNYVSFLGALLGWDCWPSGLASTGYLAPGTANVTFRQRAQSDVIAYNPEIVLIAGGINDQRFSASALGAEAAALYSQLQNGLPNTRIVVIGPWSAGTPASSLVLSVRDTLSAQAASAGLQFVDPTGWVTGTGNAGSAPVSGNASYYTSADGVHPTQAGHEYLGHRLASELMRGNLL